MQQAIANWQLNSPTIQLSCMRCVYQFATRQIKVASVASFSCDLHRRVRSELAERFGA